MKRRDIIFDEIKIIKYTSPSKNLSNVEPNIVNFPAYDECGVYMDLTWYKAYNLYIPKLPTGVEWISILNEGKYSLVHDYNQDAVNHEVRYADKLSILTVGAFEGYNDPTVTLSKTTVDGDVSVSITSGSVKSYKLTMPAIPTGVASYSITRTGSLKSGTETFAGKSSQYEATIYHGDTLTITATATTGYVTPTVALSNLTTESKVIGPVVARVTSGGPISYWLDISGFGTTDIECEPYNAVAGLDSIVIKRTSTLHPSASTGTIFTAIEDSSVLVYYGDVITASAVVDTGYNASLNWTSLTVTGTPTALVATTRVNAYTISITNKPTGVDTYTVERLSSPLQDAATGRLSNGDTIYYGDILSASATPSTGYENPKLNWTSITVTGDVSSTIEAGVIKSFNLTYPAKPTGVSSYTITRTKSPIKNATTGVIVNSPSTGGTVTVYYNDELSITASAHEAFNAPTYKLSSTKVTSAVTATVTAGSVKAYWLDVSGFGTTEGECEPYNTVEGLNSITVKVTSSPYANKTGTTTFVHDSSMAVYYGDVLTASMDIDTPYLGSLNWTSYNVSGEPTDLVATLSVKSYKLTIGAKPTGVSTYTVSRTESQYAGATLGALSNGATIYYGDKLTASATATTGYNNPSLNWTNTTVTDNVSSSVTAGSVKTFTLTISNKPTGVATHTVSRTSSPLGGASSGTLSNGTTIYYGDTLTASATAATGYNAPSLNWTSTTVTSAVTSTATAGSVQEFKLTISAKPTGVATHTVSRTSSPLKGASSGALSNGSTIYYNDVLSASATATTGYYDPTLNWTSKTVNSAVTSTATAGSVKSYKITIPSKPTGVASFTVSRTSSPLAGASNSVLKDQDIIYHGDTLTASATATTGYDNPTLGWSSKTVTGDTSISIYAGSVKSYTLTIAPLIGECSEDLVGGGVSKVIVTRTSSPLKGAATGTLATTTDYGVYATVYHGDVLTATVEAVTGYNASLNWTSLTVSGTPETLTANSSIKTFTVSFVSNNTSYGTVNKSSITGVPYGSSISVSGNKVTIYGTTVTATETTDTAQYDYSFSSWSNTSGTITENRTITANFNTPSVINYKVSFTNPSYGAWGNSSLTLPYGTTYSVSGNSITFTQPNGSKVTNTATATSPTARTLSFGTASYGSWNSTSSVSVYDYSYSTPTINVTTGTITGATTISASNTRSNVTFTNSLGGTSGTNSTYSGSHTWTISGKTTTGADFTRTFTSTTHDAQYYYVISRSSSATQATSNITFTPTVTRSTHTYVVTISGGSYGTVKNGSTTVSSGTAVNYGTQLTVTPTAATGYTTTVSSSNGTISNNVLTVVGTVTITFTRTANTYYVYYKQGLASSTTNLPSTQSRTYPNAITLATNSMSKNNTTSTGYKVTYYQGSASSATNLPSAQSATDTTSYKANGWSTGASNLNDLDYANGASFGSNSTSDLTLYPNFTSTLTRGSVTLAANSMTKSNTNDYSYTVTYNYNGSGASNTTATATKVRKYTANGWTTTNGSQTRTHTDGQSVQMTSDLSLYPCFTQSTSGGSVTLPTPTRAGHTFLGWHTSSMEPTCECDETGYHYCPCYSTYVNPADSLLKGGESYTPTANITLYAIWSINSYTVTINGSSYGTVKVGSSTISSGASVVYGTQLTITPTAATGYTTTASSSTGTISNNTMTVDGNETITFTRTGNTYYVYYNKGISTGGTLPSTQSRTYPNSTTISSNSMTKSNTTANSYTVAYAQGNASNTTNLPSTQTSVNTTTYTANGWTTGSSNTNDRDYANGASVNSASDLTLYPNFTTSTTNGGVTTSSNTMSRSNTTSSGYKVTYYQGTATGGTVPTAQTATDTTSYTHSGWSTSASGSKTYNKGAATGVLSANITLYPYFDSSLTRGSVTLSTNNLTKSNTSAGSYTITYKYNGNGQSDSTASAARTTSYTANGWTTTSGSTTRTHTNGQSVQMTGTLSLYPCFSQSTSTAAVTLPTPTRTGYTFKGWSTSSTATSGSTGSYTPTGNVTLYATWAANTYYVYYNKGLSTGGTLPGTQSRTYPNAVTLATNSMTKSATTSTGYKMTYAQGSASSTTNLPSAQSATDTTSYTANGWTTSSTATNTVNYANGASFGSSSTTNLTLYPNFTTSLSRGSVTLATNNMTKSSTTISSYTVTYNYNGSGAANTTATATKTKSYTANGWTTTSGSTSRTYTNGQSVQMTGNITVYPCFSESTSGGSVTLPTPTRTGYTFKGWSALATGKCECDATDYHYCSCTGSYVDASLYSGGSTYTPSGNITLYAIWEINRYTVSFTVNTSGYGTVSPTSIANVPYGAAISASSNTVTISGTKVTATPTATTAQYSYSFSSWSNTSGTITAARTITANFTRTTRTYSVSYPAKPTGVGTFTIYLNGTAKVTNPTSASSFTATYGDKVYATVTAATGYNNPSISGVTTSSSGTSVTGAISISVSAGSVKSFTLSYPAKPAGVASYVIKRTSSPYKGASTGNLVSSPSSAGSTTVYYGDVLSITATAATNYGTPTAKLSATTVTANVTATVTAGAYSEPYYTCDCCGYYGPASDFAYIDAYSAICKNCN